MKEIPNLSYIDKISNGNTLFTKTLLGIIKKELSGEIESYQFHLKNGSFTKTAKEVHKLSHKIRILGLKKGFKIAEKYSSDLLEHNLKLKMDFDVILTSMLLFIKKV
jgi:hypothetical protein